LKRGDVVYVRASILAPKSVRTGSSVRVDLDASAYAVTAFVHEDRVIPAEVIDAMRAALVLAKERLDIKERQLAGHRVGHMPQRVFDDLDRTANTVGVIDVALAAFDASRGGKP
jgi:hypothetical protein